MGQFSVAVDTDDRAVIVGADGTVLIESTPGKFERIVRARREAITTVLTTGPDSVLLFGEGEINGLTLPSSGPIKRDGRQ